ncbi:integrase catalytic domain-containing protein [Trichonephila clavipes]|nr:integrase catalytic domain-containing protein [Trichonephila clavipes]
MNNCVSISLHTFWDASKLSYATAIFLRSESESQVSVQLVLAKSRIAPLKAMSIPKLELMACTIGVRLTDMNPADLPSRGCSAKKLTESRWWEGPQWLTLSGEKWPHSNPIVDKENVDSERRKVAVTAINNVNDLSSRVFSYFSKYNKILRMIGWMYKFVENLQKKREEREHGQLKVHELEKAENLIVKLIQLDSFSSEDGKKFKSLSVFTDE